MAFSDLCHISNAFKTVENEADQSERIMEENAMVRDLITKILDETGPGEASSSIPPPENSVSSVPTSVSQYTNNDTLNSFGPSTSYNYNNNLYNFNQSDNGYNYNIQNGFNTNGFVNYSDNDVNPLLCLETVTDDTVTQEQLNLLRLAAQEIGGAQFTSPTKYDEKFFNYFEPNQRNSLPETSMYSSSYSRPNSLDLDLNFNSNYDNVYTQRIPNKYENGFPKEQLPESPEVLAYLSQLSLNIDRARNDALLQSDYKLPVDMGSAYQGDDFSKMQEERNKLFYGNRGFQQVPNKSFNCENSFYSNDLMSQMTDRNFQIQNYDFSNPSINALNYKMNGYHQHDYSQRRDVNQLLPRDGYQGTNVDRTNFDSIGRENAQQTILKQQELARQMSLLMRSRPPPNQLNVDVSFLHENTPFNIGIGALVGPSPPHVPPPVIPSPLLDLPVLVPFYAMRNMRTVATTSSVLHVRLDECYEQWKQLERERKRTEARLALAYPGRAVSSSNSIPVPRLPPCPTRVDRLTVDMLREHTKVLTLMGKMETLRASVCVAQNKKPNKPEDGKITVLKRGQDNLSTDKEIDPATFEPSSWKDDVKNLSEIAPHSEVESAMLAWRNSVAAVQAARRRELAPPQPNSRVVRPDPIVQLSEAVKQLCECARRARCAMWCDLTLTVALAPHAQNPNSPPIQKQTTSPKQSPQETAASATSTSKPQEQKEEKVTTETNQPSTSDTKQEIEQKYNKERNTHRRTQNFRKVHQRNDFYQRNPRYDNRMVHNRHPYYLATGPIN
ncbi:uncharacterized protein LOC124539395 [Vanessa cardui]|uniref:uncharacterized protein LOC124539395 n=1 Tax=Vanessa cardui TaxID=171605 RepID=UPI001F14453D|nr:uncharacterized protein LOC124539395 [Vanessa cardui]